jgi:hypothetical protein
MICPLEWLNTMFLDIESYIRGLSYINGYDVIKKKKKMKYETWSV